MFTNLWECNKTIQEMLKARGYSDHFDDEQIDHTNIVKEYQIFEDKMKSLMSEVETSDKVELTQNVLDKLTYLRQHEFSGDFIYVFFVIDKIGVNLITGYVESMAELQVSRAILVSVPNEDSFGNHSILTPFAQKEINRYKQKDGKIIEHFYFDSITKNILDHELEPKEIKILTDDEKDEVLLKINSKVLDKSDIPPLQRIRYNDPLAKFLGLLEGDIIECICNSETVGECVRYRVCYNKL